MAIATTTSLAKETEDHLTADANRTCSNGKDEKNKCSSKESGEANGTTEKVSLYNGCEQREELLQLWGIWTLSKEL